MRPRRDVPSALLDLAAQQGGLLTSSQGLAAMGRGPIRRLLAQGDWQLPASGLYLPSPLPIGDEQRLWAGFLLGGEGSALGGRAALFAAGIVKAPAVVDVWLPAGRRRASRPGWSFREDFWDRLSHVTGTLPRIRLEEALLDVAPGCDVEGWVELLAEATRLKRVALAEVVRRLDLRPKASQREMLRDVAIDLQGIESNLEWVYRRDVERAHGLPEGDRQARVVGTTGAMSGTGANGSSSNSTAPTTAPEPSVTSTATTSTHFGMRPRFGMARSTCGAGRVGWLGR